MATTTEETATPSLADVHQWLEVLCTYTGKEPSPERAAARSEARRQIYEAFKAVQRDRDDMRTKTTRAIVGVVELFSEKETKAREAIRIELFLAEADASKYDGVAGSAYARGLKRALDLVTEATGGR